MLNEYKREIFFIQKKVFAVILELQSMLRELRTMSNDFPISVDDMQDDTPVSKLYLGTRAYNMVVTEGIRTVGELRVIPDGQLLRMPNMGPKTVADIKEAIAEYDAEKKRKSAPTENINAG